MDWAIWGALILCGLAVLGAGAWLGVRVLEARRGLKRYRRHVGKELDSLTDTLERTSKAAGRASDTHRIETSLRRLRVSLARLAVLRAALDEATDALGRFTAVYPRK